MTPEEREIALEHLMNPKMPNPMVSFDTGKLIRDLPPRRTLRERMRALLRLPPKART
jgi:hypothetical protein